MVEKPLIIFPEPAPRDRLNKSGGRPSIHYPSFPRQSERIGPRIQFLEQQIESGRAQVSADLPDAEPEMVVVFETIGSIQDFMNAVSRVEGLEWLAEWDEYDISADEDFYDEENASKPLNGRLYLVMSNQKGIKELLSLWQIRCENPEHPHFERGLGRWRYLFNHLKDVRRWGPDDRLLETGLREDWESRALAGEEDVYVEIELWFRRDAEARTQARENLAGIIHSEGGEVIQEACIQDIRYHAILARLPINAVEKLVAKDAHLVRCESVMFFRPTGQMSVPIPVDQPFQQSCREDLPECGGEPLVALLDGLPLEHHACLDGRVVVDDPDGWAADYPVIERVHGTAMASLILHGDLNTHNEPLVLS